MKPTHSQVRIKACARKNSTPVMNISDDDESDSDIFINDDAKRRFTDYISSRGLFSERGFSLDLDDVNLGLPARIGLLIADKKWNKLYQHPNPYNIQIVKEFYSNLKPSNKKIEVMETLSRADEKDYEVYIQSLCNPNTTWVEFGGVKSVTRMNLKPKSKALYQFIKHSIKPTTHIETINK
ncbi:hypothetical protein RYX36_036194 [Vicia faba]